MAGFILHLEHVSNKFPSFKTGLTSRMTSCFGNVFDDFYGVTFASTALAAVPQQVRMAMVEFHYGYNHASDSAGNDSTPPEVLPESAVRHSLRFRL